MTSLEKALANINRRLIGRYGSRRSMASQSRYQPHQGTQEKERRVRQLKELGHD